MQQPIDYEQYGKPKNPENYDSDNLETPEGAKKNIPGKARCGCPFRHGHFCNDKCGLFCVGLNSCVFHAINLNLSNVNKSLKVVGTQLELLNKKMPKKFSLNRAEQDGGKTAD